MASRKKERGIMDESFIKLPTNPPIALEAVITRTLTPEAAPRMSSKRCKARELEGPQIVDCPKK